MDGRKEYQSKIGDPRALGVRHMEQGWQFAVEAEAGKEVSLLLYPKGKTEVCQEIPMPAHPFYGKVRTVVVEGLPTDRYEYNYRIGGKTVPDPRARKLVGRGAFGSSWPGEEGQLRCGFVTGSFGTEEEPPQIPYEEMIVYKVHVRGYTRQSYSRVKKKGTFLGLIEKIPYWQELGVNTIELMPAYEFLEVAPLSKEQDQTKGYVVSQISPARQLNYWGYGPGFYYAPKSAYASGSRPEEEFAMLVSALHQAGMNCIMEFFFDHRTGPMEIVEILRYWKMTYQVDGFHLIGEGIPQEMLVEDPVLAGSKLWFLGLADAYRDMGKPGEDRRLAEYNGGFSQDMRRLLKSDEGMLPGVSGYLRRNPSGYGVINYITMQDGFTLADLVSYDNKHNEANGEDNRDGSSYNFSWNCGVEGPTRKQSIRALRLRQMKNAWMLLLLAQGTPLLYGGDEFGNSQEGNNNAYCQDNEIGWVDWKGQKKNEELTSFVKKLIAFRKAHPILHMQTEPKGSDYKSYGFPDLSYHSQKAWYAGMEHTSRYLGVMYCCAYAGKEDIQFLYLAYNFHWEPKEFALPSLPEGVHWEKGICTQEGAFVAEDEKLLCVPPRTVQVLLGRS